MKSEERRMNQPTEKFKSRYSLPAEWEPQSMVQLTWPHENTDWAEILDEVYECFICIKLFTFNSNFIRNHKC